MNDLVSQILLWVFTYFLLSMVFGIVFFMHRNVFRRFNDVVSTKPSLDRGNMRARKGKVKQNIS